MSTAAAFKLGGALGIGAVAINIWIKNWEHVKGIFAGDWSHGAAGVIQSITDALLTGAASLVNFSRGLGAISLTTNDLAIKQRGLAERAAQKAANEKATASAESAVSGVGSHEEEARGALFREALAKYGGGDKLRQEMLNEANPHFEAAARARVKANPGLVLEDELQAARKKARDSVNLEIANAMKGRGDAMDRIAKGRPGLPGAVDVEQQAIEAQGLANDRAFRAKQREKAEAERQQQADYEQQGREYERNFQAKQREKDEREADRYASALQPRVGKTVLRGGSAQDIEAEVKQSLERSGADPEKIGRVLAGTVKKIQEKTKEEIENRAASRGISADEAKGQLLKEELDREKKESMEGRRPAGVQSDQDFYRSILAPGSVPKDEIPRQQLDVQKQMANGIQEVANILQQQKGAEVVARVAPMGAR